jgi:Phosphate-starvation-inducible E family
MADERVNPQLPAEGSGFFAVSRVMVVGERIVFTIVGILLFVAALALAYRSVSPILSLFTSPSTIGTAAYLLNVILLILMIAEIAYTVTLSVRGIGLSPQPFLIVGLIAVIRRILVITVQEVQPTTSGKSLTSYFGSSIDVAILTLVVLAFVFSIYLLRRRKPDGFE